MKPNEKHEEEVEMVFEERRRELFEALQRVYRAYHDTIPRARGDA